MQSSIMYAVAFAVGAALAPVSGSNAANAQPATTQADTATVRLHISGMTCGTCPLTARKALDKLDGVYGSTVTYADSLAVVRFDPRKVTPAAIAAHLTRMTGYGARVLPDASKVTRP